MAIFHGNAIPSGDTEYTIDYSARWDKATAPYGYWTPSSAGDSTEFTISFWYKISSIGDSVQRRTFFSAGPVTHNEFMIGQGYNGVGDYLWISGDGGGSNKEVVTTAKHRDTSGWYHIVVAVDTSQSGSNKCKIYINGVEETNFQTDNRSSFVTNQIVNSTVRHEIGRFARVAGHCHDGYLAEFHSVDGTALTADSFGEFDEDYGHWKPIAYTGSHGTNGFYLDFKSSNLGNDAAGSNNFTTPSVHASDQMLDTPTNNFPTYNPLTKASGHTFAEGNLKLTGSGGHNRAMSTFGFDSGKWYYEVLIKNYGGNNPAVGIVTTIDGGRNWSTYTGSDTGGFGYYTGGVNSQNNNWPSNGGTYSTYTTGDIIGVACDMDNLKVYFYKNGSNAITSGTAYETLEANTTYAFSTSTYGSGVQIANFGQDGTFAGEKTAQGNADGEGYGNFYYTPPTGFLALCTKNLPEPAVVPRDNFEAVIYTGNNAATQVVTTSFEPDFVWSKIRSGYHHRMLDRVRGFTNALYPNGNWSENNYTDYGYITASSATSVTIGQGTHSNNLINDTGNNGVFWNWKANGAGSSNTDGSITSTVSANVSAGFSIVSYTGNDASSATIGHGLSKAPELIILKPRNKVDDWLVGSLQPARSWDWTDYMCLQLTDNVGDHTFWNDTAPTASVFSVGTSNTVNGNYNYIAYCFHDVEGYRKIGSYMGGGSASQGVFVYTGFKPAFVMIKSTNRNSSSWNMYDTTRSPYNQTNQRLRADSDAAESTNLGIDIISNGFTPKTIDGQLNTGDGQYMYMAFAEMPLKYANAR